LKHGFGAQKDFEPEEEPRGAWHFTRDGNEISPISQGDWVSDGVGVYELRLHVGRSNEGYHAGLEISKQGGEGSWAWSAGHPTEQAAESAAIGMQDGWTREMMPELERIEALQPHRGDGNQGHEF